MKTKRMMLKSVNPKQFLAIPIAILALTLFSLNASGQKAETGMKDGAYQKVDVMPVKLNGKTVPVWFMVPINFTLK